MKKLKKQIKAAKKKKAVKRLFNYDDKLDPEEQELLDSIERGEWKTVDNFEEIKAGLEEAAKNHIRREKIIMSLVSKKDFMTLKKKATRKGMTYQEFITSILHQYAIGDLAEKAA